MFRFVAGRRRYSFEMRAVVQRVSKAVVTVEGRVTGSIEGGLLVLVGVAADDTEEDLAWLAVKIVQQKLFADATGRMNWSVTESGGGILVVSQFTLLASTRKGTKPSWHRAAGPEVAVPLYERFVRKMEELLGRPVATGEFGAMMEVELVNDGPVTLVLDSRWRE
ncbi:MAG: D-aminoacyl-tRNA deacylase [Chthoniobacterales bacterium]